MPNPSIYLQTEEYEALQAEAEKQDRSLSWLVRNAIRRTILADDTDATDGT